MTDLETLIKKATDGTLTSDNWRYIMEVCDEVSASPERNTKVAIQTLKTQLSCKDANVMLRTLSLLVALAENCGSRMQQEIATTAFLQEYLMKKLADKKLHIELKTRIADTIAQLHNSFKGDPSLKPMSDAYQQLMLRYSQFVTSRPDKPAKTELTSQDRQNQDLELERALKLSVQEYEREQSLRRAYLSEKPLPLTNDQPAEATRSQQPQQNTPVDADSNASIASVKKVRALYDLISYEADELSFRKGDVITVIESVYRDWWRGSLPNGKVGIFPLNYVTPVVSKTAQELARELQIETDLTNSESRKIDKLLSLLSSNPDHRSEEEITQLYNSIIPHRATLAKLIESYSSRKDELRLLNDQLILETKCYNELLDSLVVMHPQNMAAINTTLPYPSSAQPQPLYKLPSAVVSGSMSAVSTGSPRHSLYSRAEPLANQSIYYQQQGEAPYPHRNRY